MDQRNNRQGAVIKSLPVVATTPLKQKEWGCITFTRFGRPEYRQDLAPLCGLGDPSLGHLLDPRLTYWFVPAAQVAKLTDILLCCVACCGGEGCCDIHNFPSMHFVDLVYCTAVFELRLMRYYSFQTHGALYCEHAFWLNFTKSFR